MRKAVRCLLAFLLCMMVFTGALAEISLIPQMDEWDDSCPLEVELSADVAAHMPFDDNRCAQLNALLKHLSLHLNSCILDGETLGRVSLRVDGTDVAWITQKENAAETQLRFSWQPELTYSSAEDALGTLTGTDATEEISADKLRWLDEGYTLLNDLRDALTDYGRAASIKTNIKNMGVAREKVTYTIPKTDVELFWKVVSDSCPDGSRLENFLTGLTFSGQQKLIIWLDGEGNMLRAEYAGKCGTNAESLRQVKLVWRMCRTEDAVRDDVSLKTPAVKGNDYNTLTLTRNLLRNEHSTVTLDGKLSYLVRAGKEKSSFSGEADLTGTPDAGDTLLSGSLSVKCKLPENDETTSMVVKPDMRLGTDGETPFVSGKVQVQKLYDGHVTEDAVISIDVSPGTELAWKNADAAIDLDAMSEQQMQNMMQGLSQTVVPHLVLLPGEDTLYLSADLPEEVWQRIVEAAHSALPEEVIR